MTLRTDIISVVGRNYLQTNIENDEFSFKKAFKNAGIQYEPIKNSNGREYKDIDIRFEKDGVTLLVETKQDYDKDPQSETQLSAYVEYEKQLTGNKIISVLANTKDDRLKVWRGVISIDCLLPDEYAFRSMEEYVEMYSSKVNDKERVMENTYELNELLHTHGISEKLRSQFVGTCLLALKNGLHYSSPSLKTSQINSAIKDILGELLNKDIYKAEKLALLNKKILESQDIRELKIENYRIILRFIEEKILPFINDRSTSGQDLLNLFFITFNKYVGKADKNQAFTPDHITDFMSKIAGVSKHSVILDPCCGSGSFLVRSMTIALDDCATVKEQEEVKKKQIYGIEFDENIYGLATTNMLIHSDGNSNLRQGSCFDFADLIKEVRPNVILMNPPYNAQRKNMPEKYVATWDPKCKEDPSGGLYFVKFIADCLNSINQPARLAVLLPVSCAIGTKNDDIKQIRKEILKENTLDAVFSLPIDIFHPGASATACCMVFNIGKKHNDITNPDTFFGYYRDDGFKKKKDLGRVEKINSVTGEGMWAEIENLWIDLYRNRKEVDGLSCNKKVDGEMEWLCEAYMKTDYSKLTEDDFQQTVNEYLGYLIKAGKYQ